MKRKDGNMTLRKSRHKYKNGENIQEGDKVFAYGSGVYREDGEECYISFEDNQWLVESPSAKMGYFLRDVLKNGYLEKINCEQKSQTLKLRRIHESNYK